MRRSDEAAAIRRRRPVAEVPILTVGHLVLDGVCDTMFETFMEKFRPPARDEAL